MSNRNEETIYDVSMYQFENGKLEDWTEYDWATTRFTLEDAIAEAEYYLEFHEFPEIVVIFNSENHKPVKVLENLDWLDIEESEEAIYSVRMFHYGQYKDKYGRVGERMNDMTDNVCLNTKFTLEDAIAQAEHYLQTADFPIDVIVIYNEETNEITRVMSNLD